MAVSLANRRTDHWGGDLTNRARLLLDIVRDVRAGVSPALAKETFLQRRYARGSRPHCLTRRAVSFNAG